MQTILSFLEQLEAKNTTERMHSHQEIYKQAKGEVLLIAQECIKQIAAFDPSIADLEAPETLFRLARDTRFSKDKSPYKTNMGIVIAPGGKKSLFPCYYIHLQPGNRSFLAGGLHCPEPKIQKAVRDALVTKSKEFLTILDNPTFQETRGPLQGDAYKKVPRDYPADHPAAELLKQKEFLVIQQLSDKQVLTQDFIPKSSSSFQLLFPFNSFLREAIVEQMKNTPL